MSSLFSVSKLLAKGRGKANKRDRAAPTRSSSSTTVEKDKERSSTSSYPAITSINVEQPVAGPDTPKAGPRPSLELESISEKGFSSPPLPLGESIEIIPEANDKGKAELVEEPGYAVVAQPEPQTPEALVMTEEKEKVGSVEEAGYAVVLQPKARISEVEWTTLEDSSEEKEVEEKDTDVDTLGDKADTKVEIPLLRETQPGKADPVLPSEEMPRSTDRIKDVEDALRDAQEELHVKAAAVQELRVEVGKLSVRVKSLEKEKEEVKVEVGREKQELVEEIQRLKGIIDVERLDNRERIADLEKENDEKSETIDRLKGRLGDQQEEVGEVYARNLELEAKLQRHEEGFEEENDGASEKESHIRMLEMNNENLTSQLVQVQTTVSATERENRMLLDQIRQQSNELQSSRGVSMFSSAIFGRGIASASRDSRVESAMATIKMLNEEIFQTAASMTDRLENTPKRFVAGDDGASAMAEVLKSMLGLELVKTLQEEAPFTSEDYNPFIQIALQGCLIASCMRIITSWYPAEWEYGNFLFALYERIRGTGGPDIALHWRKATQQSCFPSTDRNTKLVAYLTEQVQAVLTVCGWSKQSEVEEMVGEKYAQNLADIVSHAIRLNGLTTGGGSGDLVGVLVEAGKIFNGDQMVNDSPFGSSDGSKVRDDRPAEDEVVCTVALGLKRVDISGVEVDQILFKPKVVLNGVLW